MIEKILGNSKVGKRKGENKFVGRANKRGKNRSPPGELLPSVAEVQTARCRSKAPEIQAAARLQEQTAVEVQATTKVQNTVKVQAAAEALSEFWQASSWIRSDAKGIAPPKYRPLPGYRPPSKPRPPSTYRQPLKLEPATEIQATAKV